MTHKDRYSYFSDEHPVSITGAGSRTTFVWMSRSTALFCFVSKQVVGRIALTDDEASHPQVPTGQRAARRSVCFEREKDSLHDDLLIQTNQLSSQLFGALLLIFSI